MTSGIGTKIDIFSYAIKLLVRRPWLRACWGSDFRVQYGC
jgi:hypothetical protein